MTMPVLTMLVSLPVIGAVLVLLMGKGRENEGRRREDDAERVTPATRPEPRRLSPTRDAII